jgi:hypothetical protein
LRPRRERSAPLLVDEGFGVGVTWVGVGVGVGGGVGVAVGAGAGVGVEAGIGGTGEIVVVIIGGSGSSVIPDAGTGSVGGPSLEVGVAVGCRLAVGAGDAAGMRGTGTMLCPTATAGTWLPAAAGEVPESGIAVGSSVGAWMPTPERRMASGKSLGLGAEPPKPAMAPTRKRRPAINAAAANRICSTPPCVGTTSARLKGGPTFFF